MAAWRIAPARFILTVMILKPAEPLRIEPVRPPARGFGFESLPLTVSIYNSGVAELARADRAGEFVGTIDLYNSSGALHRRLLETPLNKPVAVGAAELYETPMYVRAFEGDYTVKVGLYHKNGNAKTNSAPDLIAESEPFSLKIKNTIFDAFVELVNSCNFRCTFCPQTDLQRKQKPMDFSLAMKIVRELAEMEHHYPIRVHLMGEPLLYPRFFDFVEQTHALGQRVLLATNGSRFQKDRIQRIFDSRLDEMVISLNTPEREGYDAQRGTEMPFEMYMDGIENMVGEIVRRGPPPSTRVNVLYDLTKADDPAERDRVRGIVNYWSAVARRFGVREIPAAEEIVTLDPTGTTLLKLCEGLELQWTPYHGWGVNQTGGTGEGSAIRNHVPSVPLSRDAFCSFPWRQLAFLVDGNATACCVDAEGEIILGNANERRVEEIWNGPELSKLRAGFMQSRAFHPVCVKCYVRHNKSEFFPES